MRPVALDCVKWPSLLFLSSSFSFTFTSTSTTTMFSPWLSYLNVPTGSKLIKTNPENFKSETATKTPRHRKTSADESHQRSVRHRRSISHQVINKTRAKLQAHGTNQDEKFKAFLAEQSKTRANQNEKLNEILAKLKDMMMPLISKLGRIEPRSCHIIW